MSYQHGLSVEQVHLTDVVVGLLCGRGGEKLNQLQAQSGCWIQLAQDRAGPEHRVCTLTGTPSAIAVAKRALHNASQPQQQPTYGASQLSSIEQYNQQAAHYRLLGMSREAEMLERQVAMWSQAMHAQQQQQEQLSQYYRAMAGAGVAGGETVAYPEHQRNEELED